MSETHEQLNQIDGEWWRHDWAGIYAGLMRDMGYEPYDNAGEPRYLLFFDPPGKWRMEEQRPGQAPGAEEAG